MSDDDERESSNGSFDGEQENCDNRDESLSIYSGQDAIQVVTENDLIQYFKTRIQTAQLCETHWPPLMLLIFNRHNRRNMSEFLIAAIELLLDVPIQINLKFSEKEALETEERPELTIDLNREDVFIPFGGRLFVSAKQFVRKLLSGEEQPCISIDEIRPRARFLFR